jgi:hypothetical protein
MNDIKKAVESIVGRRNTYTNAEDYYRGSQGELFAHEKWGKLFRANGTYVLNYAKTVVDTVLDRLEIASVKGVEAGADETINRIFESNDLVIDSTEIHRRTLMYGDCYAIVWPDEEGEVQITYNAPLTTVVIYDVENPRKKDYAAKAWETLNAFGKKQTNLNLYYADRIEKFTRQGELDGGAAEAHTWTATEVVENPFGEVPVFHFRTHRPYGTPEHAAAIGPQDAINKMVNNHMLTVDYQGAPQRYALSSFGNQSEFQDFDDDDTIRENLNGLKSGPGEFWYLNGVTQVGQFAPADPAVFTGPILEYVKSMASLTQTPLHYFQNNGQFASGEALRTAEAPLVKKVRDRQLSLGATWREVFRFALRIEGIESDVQVNWQSVESMDSTDMWSIAQIKRAMGIPLITVLTEMGYDLEVAREIAEEVKKAEEEAAKAAAAGATAPGAAPTVTDLSIGMNAHNAALKAAKDNRQAQTGAGESATGN